MDEETAVDGGGYERKGNLMGSQFMKASDVNDIANEIIARHHPHLVGIPFYYVFHPKAKMEAKTHMVLAKASKLSGLPALLARNMLPQFDFGDSQDAECFVISVAFDAWEKLSASQRRALIDHELMHCGIDQDEKLYLHPHDIEDFGDIMRRHGLWKPDLREFARAISQGPQGELFTDDANAPEQEAQVA